MEIPDRVWFKKSDFSQNSGFPGIDSRKPNFMLIGESVKIQHRADLTRFDIVTDKLTQKISNWHPLKMSNI